MLYKEICSFNNLLIDELISDGGNRLIDLFCYVYLF